MLKAYNSTTGWTVIGASEEVLVYLLSTYIALSVCQTLFHVPYQSMSSSKQPFEMWILDYLHFALRKLRHRQSY